MINRYTADRRLRHDDAYTPDNVAGKRPDRATLVYTQRCKEAWKDVPVILGGIEASLRRTAHYDYWSDTVRRSVLVDSKADMLMFGNGERPLVEVAHRLAMGEPISEIRDVRNTAIIVKEALRAGAAWIPPVSIPEGKSTRSRIRMAKICRARITNLLRRKAGSESRNRAAAAPETVGKTYVLLPSFEKVKGDKVLYAHASRILHHETNPRLRPRIDAKTWRPLCVDQPACYSALYRRDGQRFCAAVQARAASGLWQCSYSGLRNDPFLGQHYAWLLWWLFFLFYYRA